MTKNRKTYTGTLGVGGALNQATPFFANYIIIENTGNNDITVQFNGNGDTAFPVHAGCVRKEEFPLTSFQLSSASGSTYEVDVYEDAAKGY